MNHLKRLGTILVELGHLTKAQLDLALRFQTHQQAQGLSTKLGEFLLSQRCISAAHLEEALNLQQQLEDLAKATSKDRPAEASMVLYPDPRLFEVAPLDLARKYRFVPLALREDQHGRTLYLASSNERRSYLEE